jgi:putative ABC transport system permease protein
MGWLSEFWRRLAFLFHRKQFDSDLEEEMRYHLERKAADLDAFAARRQFGNATFLREESRDAWGWGWLERAWQDVRFAHRMLRKNAAVTALALMTLAIGIGANTLIFTVVHAVLLSPLPYKEPQRLVRLLGQKSHWVNYMSGPDVADIRAQSTAFEDIAMVSYTGADLTEGGEPEHLQGSQVSANAFSVLGVSPIAGRGLNTADDEPNAPPVVVLSYALWQRRFGGERSVIGKPVVLGKETRTVVGVMPSWFRFPDPETQLWVPVPAERMGLARGKHLFSVFARLKPGATVEQARAEVKTIADRLARAYPDSNTGWSADAQSLTENIVGGVRSALSMLLGAVGLVLLVACANVANLSLSRGFARRQEMAVRAALGAGRGRLARLLFVENLVLALCGGGLGVLLAVWGLHALAPLYPPRLPRTAEIRIDAAVLAFTMLVSLATAILVGLLPALRLSRTDLNAALKAGVRSRGARTGRTRAVLVVAQVALAMVLVTCAGLLIKSFLLRTRISGFSPDNVLIAQLPTLPSGRVDAIVDRVRTLPGVTGAAATTSFSYVQMMTVQVEIAGRPGIDSPIGPMFEVVTADYFRTLGVPLRKGRGIEERDIASAPPVAVINETMAHQYFPGADAIGKQIRLDPKSNWLTIVGVIADVGRFNADVQQKGALYVPHAQFADFDPTAIAIRTAGSPKATAPSVRAIIHEVAPKSPIAKMQTMRDDLFGMVATEWFYTLILGLFGAMALSLAALGVYGAVSVAVSLRTHEIGVRMALGAARGDVRAAVMREGLMLAAAGAAIGAGASWMATRLLLSTGLLFQVTPRDPLTFALVPAVLLAAAMAACWGPARRATRVDPVIALRYE